jgi:alpha-N-arabinofuranosidase
MSFVPKAQESAGLAVVQAMNHQYHLQLTLAEGEKVLQLLRFTADFDLPPYIPGFTSETHREVLAQVPWEGESVVLQMELHGNDYTFRCGETEHALKELATASGAAINPEKVGCMTGEIIGVFASGNGEESDNSASFDWVEFLD